jgi:hypothetical protein
LGHALDYGTGKKHRDALKQLHLEIDGKKVDTAKWAQANISEYAKTNTSEALAEMFALYTSKNYKPGALPPAIEKIMVDLAKRK